ncbi:MobQ family relaxase [Rhodanobacter sp. DHG33]|uniref:MobQ family relaxase n=1 Tax=Rhodanobacter sp. DHG33 TaxID=2775921 RepID=UPI00178349C9|nr:MobA/MobL family protein [Rhodanobacter sp. DHG33]
MAIFHLAAQIIGRAAGRSSTAAAAYRLGTVIEDERTGQCFDYSRKSGVSGWQIIGPDCMPDRLRDPARLWNAVEAAERRHDAQLCREVNVALPCELSPSQNTALVLDWCQQFVDAGMIACVALHQLENNNPHAHVMLTLREIAQGGFGVKVRAWNDRRVLDRWRETWAEKVNQHLATAGMAERVDHRTLEAQGVERAPTQHQGPIAHAMEQRGEGPDRLSVIAPTPRAMNHTQAVIYRAREQNVVGHDDVPEHVRQATEAVEKAHEALHAAKIEEVRCKKAEQHASDERTNKQQITNADRLVAHDAQQRADALRGMAQAQQRTIEQWKQTHRWRVWWWRHGIRNAIPALVRQADAERIKAKRRAIAATLHQQEAVDIALASRSALVQADNAHKHCLRRWTQATQQVADAIERLAQAQDDLRDAMTPGYELRHFGRHGRQPDAAHDQPLLVNRRMRRP